MRSLRRALRSSAAQSTIEFALALPILLLLIVGILDGAIMVFQSNTLSHATREGARYAIVNPTAAPSAVQAVVNRTAIGVANVSAAVVYPDGNQDPGSRVQVSATAVFTPWASTIVMGGNVSFTLRASSTMTIQ